MDPEAMPLIMQTSIAPDDESLTINHGSGFDTTFAVRGDLPMGKQHCLDAAVRGMKHPICQGRRTCAEPKWAPVGAWGDQCAKAGLRG